MAGHSKWANIKHRKSAQDTKRGKVFTKIATEITVAVKLFGSDAEGNPRLRTALVKARGVNMPNDNIDRAIKKGLGDLAGVNYSEKTYEGYGPGGVAFVVECLTDNVNRSVSEVRHVFTKFSGNLGTDGSVSWMFHKKGQIIFERSKVKDYDALFELAIENGAEDVKEEEEIYEIVCSPADFLSLKEAIDSLGIEPDVCELTRIPETYTEISRELGETIDKMTEMLEDKDDVQNVYNNSQTPED